MALVPGSSSRTYRFEKHHPAADTAAVATLTAITDEHICVQRVDFSYDSDFAGSLTISDGTDTWKVFVTKSGPGPISGGDAPIFIGAKGAQVTVTLADPGTGKTGAVNVLYY